ncbi:hypothetical protein DUI87_05220 [Hirundo rustica rustica]|uniref:Mesothelin n=1 Tax=Hirundo rustica rustica TaxID=333673 RepID=A0A3M0LEH1_HIRRU|nr:hypothetical protein DUI87_05220 [Hirundo rustica rustica]
MLSWSLLFCRRHPSSWDSRTLQDLGPLALALNQTTLSLVSEAAREEFRSGIAAAYISQDHSQREKSPILLRALAAASAASHRRLRRSSGRCESEPITDSNITDAVLFLLPEELDLCLSSDLLVKNLEAVLEQPITTETSRVLKKKVDEFFPSGIPEEQLRRLGQLSRLYTEQEISQWQVTTSDTLAALLSPSGGPWDDAQVQQLLSRYLALGGSLTGPLLREIRGKRLCELREEQIQQIPAGAIGTAGQLNISSCSQTKKEQLYGKAREAFASLASTPGPYYCGIQPYLGGAPAEDLKDLANTGVINMDLDTFLALNPREFQKLSVTDVKLLLGKNLPELRRAEHEPLVVSWVQRQWQRELDCVLGIGLQGGQPEPTGTASPAGATSRGTATTPVPTTPTSVTSRGTATTPVPTTPTTVTSRGTATTPAPTTPTSVTSRATNPVPTTPTSATSRGTATTPVPTNPTSVTSTGTAATPVPTTPTSVTSSATNPVPTTPTSVTSRGTATTPVPTTPTSVTSSATTPVPTTPTSVTSMGTATTPVPTTPTSVTSSATTPVPTTPTSATSVVTVPTSHPATSANVTPVSSTLLTVPITSASVTSLPTVPTSVPTTPASVTSLPPVPTSVPTTPASVTVPTPTATSSHSTPQQSTVPPSTPAHTGGPPVPPVPTATPTATPSARPTPTTAAPCSTHQAATSPAATSPAVTSPAVTSPSVTLLATSSSSATPGPAVTSGVTTSTGVGTNLAGTGSRLCSCLVPVLAASLGSILLL